MTVITPALNADLQVERDSLWLRSRRWDLIFITFSVVVVPLPYLLYLLLSSNIFQLDADLSRNIINGFVAIAVGGPHMMSTFLRTGLDENFKKRYPMLIRSTVIVPVVVVSLAFLNLELLLTVFFFWASTHVLHQITYIVELYNHKERKFVRPDGRVSPSAISPIARLIDYAVILTSLFPIAAYKISRGNFDIGTNDLTRVIPGIFQQTWLFVSISGIFAVAAVAFVVKTAHEIRGGYINWPKTVFIGFTVLVAFTIPALPNLDTAFQGLNTWHSFQYLAITFFIIKIRQQYGSLEKDAPLVARFSKGEDSRGLYFFSALLLVGSAVIFAIVYALAQFFTPGYLDPTHPEFLKRLGLWRFDVAYYTALLAFLWIHYYHDHFLFTDFEALDDAFQSH
ncbi:MAG: hypothetical protein OXF83_07915 [Anaerolineaceae bacterium]|nr:hypothetical protein [Anaerolineaceae bacterium]MCY3936025.1 hypothetical protein [Chloroflexota bacterium]MCY4008246.1 hypothetical protein [Anaerolineaceae bacterium]MCY4105376.1 hypothetical protein [Chloroflexota bacterium]